MDARPPRTVSNWAAKTPNGFIFSVKVPQVITHEKVLADCDAEFREFVETMSILGPKLGPMVFQFPLFDKWQIKDRHAFADRLLPFLKKLPAGYKFAIEIRNDRTSAPAHPALAQGCSRASLARKSPKATASREAVPRLGADRWSIRAKGLPEITKPQPAGPKEEIVFGRLTASINPASRADYSSPRIRVLRRSRTSSRKVWLRWEPSPYSYFLNPPHTQRLDRRPCNRE
jgi:hypothetical protein